MSSSFDAVDNVGMQTVDSVKALYTCCLSEKTVVVDACSCELSHHAYNSGTQICDCSLGISALVLPAIAGCFGRCVVELCTDSKMYWATARLHRDEHNTQRQKLTEMSCVHGHVAVKWGKCVGCVGASAPVYPLPLKLQHLSVGKYSFCLSVHGVMLQTCQHC